MTVGKWLNFLQLSYFKELELTIKPFTGRTLCTLLILVQNISLQSSSMHRKQNFEIVFGFKSDTAVLTLYLSLSLLPSFFGFSCLIFSFAGHLVGFILVWKGFRKAVRTQGKQGGKGNKIFVEICRSMLCHGFLAFSPVSIFDTL